MKVWILIVLFTRAMDIEVYDSKQACDAAALRAFQIRAEAWCTERTVVKK